MKFPFYRQLEANDCGPTCIRMIASYYNKYYKISTLRKYCNVTRVGITPNDIIEGCRNIGLKAYAIQITSAELGRMPLPGILFWRQEHFVVLYDIIIKKGIKYFVIGDPSHDIVKLKESDFIKNWRGDEKYGVAILIQPEEDFINIPDEKKDYFEGIKDLLQVIKKNISKYKKEFSIVSILSLFAVIANLFSPLIFQKTIDDGIIAKDMNIVVLLVLGQFTFFISYTISGTISNLIQTKINFKIGIDMLYGYLHKLIRLPISFFDTKLNTDLIQRLSDQERIDSFLTYSVNNILLTLLNFTVFSVMLFCYNKVVFLIFAVMMLASVLYSKLFWKRRAVLDYLLFSAQSSDKNNVYELINGMTEIKINNAEHARVNKWKETQKKINSLKLKSLIIGFFSVTGNSFMGRLRDIMITAGCAYFVIYGNMTLGIMMTIIFIMGQLSTFSTTIVGFFSLSQDTKISFDRIDEINKIPDECTNSCMHMPDNIFGGIEIKNLFFKYPGTFNPFVLEDINLKLKKGTITAVVGASGSGKSTLIKLLLSFYYPQKGNIYLDDFKLCTINPNEWREKCGVVMQDGYIFSGSIMDNIALSDVSPNFERVKKAAEIACIDDFIEQLPMQFNTRIGNSGIGLSGGQIQRILIARAVYRDPEFIFFDEATSSLDADNERKIMENLESFYKGKTVVIVAHRLSTVKNADNIIFLKNGCILETGTHDELSKQKGAYYDLVKNQLEVEK